MTADIIDGILIELGDTYGWEIYPQFFSELNKMSLVNENFDTVSKKNAGFIGLLSRVVGEDLREYFIDLDFPINNLVFKQFYS
jgi:hypothetical protein